MKIFLSVIAAICLVPGASDAADTAPNILIVLVDDLGYGDPGCYNPESKIPTPNIDQLATDGLRFTDAHAPGPLCHLSRYGLLTGRYPFRAKFNWQRNPVIKEGTTTVPSFLKSQGYHTEMVGKWHLGFSEGEEENYLGELRGGPVDHGFDAFFGIRASTDIPPYFYIKNDRAVMPPSEEIAANNTEGWTPIQGKFWRRGNISPDLKLEEVLPRLTDEAVRVIENHASTGFKSPLFLYLALPAPHTPWLPSKEFEGKGGAGLYGEFVTMVDSEFGRVLTALENAKMSGDTLVIFTSDNGPVWFDQDVEKFGHDSSGGLRGMKADAWECGHRMPFVARWPGKVKAGTVTGQTVCFTDLLATFAAITGGKLPEGAAPDSANILPVLLGEQPEDKPVRGPIAMQSGGAHFVLRHREWKLIDRLGSGGFSEPKKLAAPTTGPAGQLYNLAEDLAETKNLYLEFPEIVSRLKKELAEIKGETPRSDRPRK